MIFDDTMTVPKMIKKTAEEYPEVIAQYKRVKGADFQPILYREMFQLGLDFGAALLNLGVKREQHIRLTILIEDIASFNFTVFIGQIRKV